MSLPYAIDDRQANRSLIGRYYHALEQKGRLSIPKTFRSVFGDTAILTSGLDQSLFLMTDLQFDQMINHLNDKPFTKQANRDWQRYLTNNATLVEFDRLGRILIPDYLIKSAGLSKEVVVVGSKDKVEIWDQLVYHTYLDQLSHNIESIVETM